MQAWDKQGNKLTYLVHIMPDALTTGKSGTYIEDYYTFIKQEDETYKININHFIYSENYENTLTASDEGNNINLQILSKEVYKNYLVYEMQITNNSANRIWINGDKSKRKIYLTNDDEVTYSAIQSEFDSDKPIILEPEDELTIKIKFNKVYNTNVEVTELVLNDIILNYDKYLQDTENYENRIELRVDLQ